MVMLQYLPTTKIGEAKNYPYGSQKTTAYFSVEHKKGKGFRGLFQTINPKTGLRNAIKKGTYSPVKVVALNTENNHYEFITLKFYGYEGINKDCKFMYENFHLFTTEQIKDIYAYLYNCIKANVRGTVTYSGVELQKVKPHIEVAVHSVMDGFKDGKNYFDKINIDFIAIEELKDPNFNPFTTTTSSSL